MIKNFRRVGVHSLVLIPQKGNYIVYYFMGDEAREMLRVAQQAFTINVSVPFQGSSKNKTKKPKHLRKKFIRKEQN